MHKRLLEKLFIQNGPLSGSSITHLSFIGNTCRTETFHLKLDTGRQVFAKKTSIQDLPMLLAEAKGLEALKNHANKKLIVIPEPIALQTIEDNAILLLPWLELGTGNQTQLGRGLALLHQSSSAENTKSFGWGTDGYIGYGPQPGGWNKNWGECFVYLRLIPQLKLAEKWGLDTLEFKELIPSLIKFLTIHKPKPSLVHGDLWSGNAGVQHDGKGVLIDPACWWADREVDLAMTRLFGGFTNEFYQGYESIWPLPKSAQRRISIYNLYHIINHANLFGGTYKNQCLSILKELKNIISQ